MNNKRNKTGIAAFQDEEQEEVLFPDGLEAICGTFKSVGKSTTFTEAIQQAQKERGMLLSHFMFDTGKCACGNFLPRRRNWWPHAAAGDYITPAQNGGARDFVRGMFITPKSPLRSFWNQSLYQPTMSKGGKGDRRASQMWVTDQDRRAIEDKDQKHLMERAITFLQPLASQFMRLTSWKISCSPTAASPPSAVKIATTRAPNSLPNIIFDIGEISQPIPTFLAPGPHCCLSQRANFLPNVERHQTRSMFKRSTSILQHWITP